MLRNRLYYTFKPFFPWRARLAVRSGFARRRRRAVAATWPILPGSEKPPAGWRGWPDGKQFGVVLTHDVEGPDGLAKCRQLMHIEKKLGFRSTFNLVPEGSYVVPKDLRDELTTNGFEVGVHDLNHDGKLYPNRREFSQKAQRINCYLREWGAVGFRSAFMLHNLEWAHELDVLYEASTFDTDPFEPQPDGVGTIFPFWVPRPGDVYFEPQPGRRHSGGYVELPYTLVQDSTLFLVLKDSTPDIWFQKLDWIAERGGMALLDTHPDYMGMSPSGLKANEYPVAHYEKTLAYIRSRYGGAYWHGTAAELAAWYKETLPSQHQEAKATVSSSIELPSLAPALTSQVKLKNGKAPQPVRLNRIPRRICMLSHSVYDSDNRVRRYAEELARRGDSVDAFALKLDPDQAGFGMLGGVKVHRIAYRSRHRQKTPWTFLWQILRFWASAVLKVSWSHFKKPYDLIHVHNVPDFLVFVALLPKLTGAKIILDIHDILPEFYVSKFGLSLNSLGARSTRLIERISARFADHVIVSNDLWRDKYAPRTLTTDRCSVFINSVDENIFRDHPRTRFDQKLLVVFPGGLHWHQGLDLAIRAFPRVLSELPNAEFHIYGSGPMRESLIALTSELGLEGKVRILPMITLD